MMSFEYIEALEKIEKKFPINTIRYQNTNVWALVRFFIMYGYHFQKPNAPEKTFHSLRSSFADVFYAYKMHLKTIEKANFLKKNDIEGESPTKKADALFLVGNSMRRIKIEDKFLNPYFEPYIPLLEKLGNNVQAIEYATVPYIFPRYFPVYNIDTLLSRGYVNVYIKRLKRKLLGQKAPIVENYENFLIFCKENNLKFFRNHDQFLYEVELLWEYKKIFIALFQEYEPKAIFLFNYEQPICQAAILAANELNIKSVEIQHGMIGKEHLTYTQFHNISEEGYPTLPTHFWCWGYEAKNTIDEWAKNTNRHQTLIGGFNYLNQWIRKEKVTQTINQKFVLFQELAIKQKHIFLFSVQPDIQTAKAIPDFLLANMLFFQDQVFWILRLHPAFNQEERDIFIQKLTQAGLRNFHIHCANEHNLYSILQEVELNFTASSTVAMEALAFKISSIIFDNYGKSNFIEAINQKAFFYADTQEAIQNLIEQHLNQTLKPNFNFAKNFFETNEDVILQNLKTFFT